MTAKPCLDCGTPSARPRCPEHRGYDAEWDRLSRRARKLQPFCSDCGATEDLQTDHLPEAWARRAAHKPIRLKDVDVVCGPCNRARGQTRPETLNHNRSRRTKVVVPQRQTVGGSPRVRPGQDAPAAESVTHRDTLHCNNIGAAKSAVKQRVSRGGR